MILTVDWLIFLTGRLLSILSRFLFSNLICWFCIHIILSCDDVWGRPCFGWVAGSKQWTQFSRKSIFKKTNCFLSSLRVQWCCFDGLQIVFGTNNCRLLRLCWGRVLRPCCSLVESYLAKNSTEQFVFWEYLWRETGICVIREVVWVDCTFQKCFWRINASFIDLLYGLVSLETLYVG